MKNAPEPLNIQDMQLLQRRLYDRVMSDLQQDDAPAVIYQVAFKMVDTANLNVDSGDVTLQQTIDELPDEFKRKMNLPEWSNE